MCKVHNPVGSLMAIKTHLHRHKLDEYKSLNELINFQKNYPSARRQIILNHAVLLEQEKSTLNERIAQLDCLIKTQKTVVKKQLLSQVKDLRARLSNVSSVQTNVNQVVITHFKKNSLRLKIEIKKLIPRIKLAYSLRPLTREYNRKSNQYQYITSNFEEAVLQSGRPELENIDNKKALIDQINSSIYGAQGEQKVVRELEKLSDDYILINDFTRKFNPQVYNRRENDYIKSIQIDHILIAPSGIFIIETKNWNDRSLYDPTFYSPVKQVQRTNFALYRLLYGKAFNLKRFVYKSRWGFRKIPIRNLIVFINHKPNRESQYVKMLTLNELLGYVRYFPPCFSPEETQKVAEYLLGLRRN